ncbi:MAG: hypothetical protein GWN71_44415 [Gammaproteobacteria bacterium]|nr:hypothetical protein [Gemmatimonadota bacterium]NIS31151.1 hypothetical protein [Actinomycetota bacterium]NIU80335.1 hypothetical protein [Gammaproteobacteria bacterium]NIX20601.1 hypothetical protein [Actinomycetota bacterium]
MGTRDSPTRLELGSPGAGTRTIFTSDLGELELRIYFEEHLDDRAEAARAAAGWDGDVYALLDHDGRLALVWYTAWDGDGEAEEFIASYRRVFAARFGGRAGTRILEAPDRRARIERADIRGIPVVRIVETPPDVEVDDPPPVRLADR